MTATSAVRRPRKLNELGFVGRGKSKHRPRDDPKLYGGDYPFFQTGDVKAAQLHLTEYSQTYNEAGLAQSKLWPPGTLCITIAANIAETAILDTAGCFPDSVVGFIAYPDDADVRFVKYYIDTLKMSMQGVSHGTTQDNLSLDKLLAFEFHVPDVAEQVRIANALAAYDELIENNQRRVRVLEEMARAVYREWFVSLRFPGHDDVPSAQTSGAPLPKGWAVRKLGQIADEMRRNVKKGELETPCPYVGLEHIPRRSLALDAWESVTSLGSNKLSFEKGEILFCKIRPYFHKVSVAPFDGLCSADTIVIRAKSADVLAFVVACVSSDEFVAHASTTANGAKMPRANWDVLAEYPVIVGNGIAADRFSRLLRDVIAQQQVLVAQSTNLRRTRDLLLPRLLSGRVSLEPKEAVA